jgi:hypothetical protein
LNYFGREKFKTKVGGFFSLLLIAMMVWYIVVRAKKLILMEDPTTTFNELYYNVYEEFGERTGKDLRYDFGFSFGMQDFSTAPFDPTYFTPVA